MNPRIPLLLQSLEARPDDPFVHYALALEYANAGESGEALLRFESARRKFPDYVPLFYQYGKLLAASGRGDEAAAVIRRGLEVSREKGDAHAHKELGGLLAAVESGEEIF